MITEKANALCKLYATELPPRAISLYLYLYQRMNKKSSCFPSVRKICEDLKLSRSTVHRAILDLEKEGFILKTHRFRENGGKSSNLYMLIV